MTEPSRSSSVPPPPPSNNGPFIGIAVVLALVLGALVVVRFRGGDDASTSTPVASAPTAKPSQAKPVLTDSIPPPPPEEEKKDDQPDGGAPKKGPAGAAGGGCGSNCSGTPSSGTRGDIGARGSTARGCYERALRSNSMLQGKITVSLTVDTNGTICGAGIASDSVGDPAVSSCILSAYRGQRVAPPTGGCANVTQTFNFQPKNKLSFPPRKERPQ